MNRLMDGFKNPRPTMLKSINKRRFLEELRRRGPSTRAELTRAIGVTPPTSSSIIADLLEAGFLEKGDTQSLGKGRPGTFFQLASTTAYVVGATVDISECRVAPAGLDGLPSQDKSLSFATPQTYPELITSLVDAIWELRRGSNGKCLGVGLAVPGLVDDRMHMVAFSPNLHMLDGQDIGSDLERALGMKVVCVQEEHALCLSEQNQGIAEGLTDFAVVDFSSGVGMGVVSNSRYVSGAQGYAGEIGHTTVEPNGKQCGCGNRGCLETVASDVALLQGLASRLGRKVGFDEVGKMWLAGDAAAQEEVATTLGYVAIGIATVVNLFNPQVVYVNGRIFQLGSEILEELRVKVEARALKPSFARLSLECTQGNKLHGAISGLLDDLFASVGPRLS